MAESSDFSRLEDAAIGSDDGGDAAAFEFLRKTVRLVAVVYEKSDFFGVEFRVLIEAMSKVVGGDSGKGGLEGCFRTERSEDVIEGSDVERCV